ncbi:MULTISPECIES: ABC transporter permease [Bradyrhizobium]|uniref:ABC transporter permease n=5 Tax=Nitrobacteraceae TaxID=41294 RepID=A0A410VHM1_9BRAD|nr:MULTISPECIES: ABC transporter permease [Bradyrhizobium]QOZ49774.1 ABC transporter permease [Bradyrhizobium sp. CCBAU 53340]QAU43139.1 ABC transporter permease [Bradyrhizobium guangdongense]QAU50635.1 ABC transporter permease [Bradyrhizobium guangzhouense]QOZ56895.1 ABC transporter permease [Bradyrhizobium sp. CCBAU 53338]QOZ64355.1 ABC transporter permease [Bradyrhizobium guangdongense]
MTIQNSLAQPAEPGSTRGSAEKLKVFIYRYGLLAVLVLMILFFSWQQPFFRTFANAMFILQAASVVAVIGLGATVSMTVGGFDLSVGASMSLAVMAATAAMVIGDLGGAPAILIAVAAGVAVGLFNTFLIVYARIPDLVATLSGLFLINGLTLLGVSGQSIAEGMSFNGNVAPGKFSPLFGWLGGGRLFGIPASVVVAGLIFIVVIVLLNYTRWGRAFYAVGGNPIAAAAAGIRVARYRMAAYLISGALAAIAGVMLAARSNRGDVNVGDAYLLQAVSAALVGYAVLGANKANAVGTLVGAVFVATLINGLTMFNFPYYAQSFVQGVLLVVALLMSYTLGPRRR